MRPFFVRLRLLVCRMENAFVISCTIYMLLFAFYHPTGRRTVVVFKPISMTLINTIQTSEFTQKQVLSSQSDREKNALSSKGCK